MIIDVINFLKDIYETVISAEEMLEKSDSLLEDDIKVLIAVLESLLLRKQLLRHMNKYDSHDKH